MSETLERQATSVAAAEQSHVDERGANGSSGDTTFGRLRELRDAGYREMPDQTPAAGDTFSSDYSGLSKAAGDLAASRPMTFEPLARQYLTGPGEQVDDKEAVTVRRAADDLVAARSNDAAEIERMTAAQATAVAEALEASATEIDGETSDGSDAATPDAARERAADADGELDPMLENALKHPKVREAIEGELRSADAARQSYVAALETVSGLLRESMFTQFPELKSDTPQQFEAALVQLAERDPARYGQARALGDRLSALQTAQLLQQQGRDAAQRREFAQYAKAEDARFDALVKAEKPEVVQRVANEIIAYATELGVPRDQFLHLSQTEPIMRNAAFQKMMFDAASYRLLQRARNEVAKKVVPPVQRPGVSVDRQATVREGEMRALNARFAANPSLKNAADMLVAQRRSKN